MVTGELLNLLGLLVDDVGDFGDVVVNHFLVVLVDKGCEEDDEGGEEGEAPEWENLDKEVGEEGTKESLGFVSRLMQ